MKFYQIDSFTDKLFGGNPAGVIFLRGDWPDEGLMQDIAAENNLSETAFVLETAGRLAIRWFTPTTEVALCGHATLAAAHVLFNYEGFSGELAFDSASGVLKVAYEDGLLTLDFPAAKIWQIDFEDAIDCFNAVPAQVWRSATEYMLIFDSQADVENAVCDLSKAAKIDLEGLIITAKADAPNVDFVSRYFAPKIGINEDPVTGSAHTILVPYWQGVTGKSKFTAAQLSKRGGVLFCEAVGERVKIAGQAATFLVGEIYL